jgi:tetratricopeptide (TPR) repeat protein
MELMMAEATKARKVKQERQAQERKKMDKSFGEGMDFKEAFSKKKKKNVPIEIDSDSEDDADEDDIVELGADGFDISDPKAEQKELPLDHPDMQQGVSLKEEGNALFKQKQYAAATRKYEQALKALPDGTPASLKASVNGNAATCQFHLGNHERAVAHANSALRFDRRYVKALYRRGLAHAGMGDLDQALADLRRALRYEPKNKLVHKAAAQVLRDTKQQKQKQKLQKQKAAAMPTITRKPGAASHQERLRLDEVQEAMRGQNGAAAADFLKAKQQEWHTPDLMERMASNPRIVAGMKNP